MKHHTKLNDVRQKIMNSALNLMADAGFDGVSVRAICQAAKVHSNSITYHFGGKENLFKDMLSQMKADIYEGSLHVLEMECATAGEFRFCLTMFFEEVLRQMLKNKLLLRLAMRERQRCGPDPALKGYHEKIQGFIRRGQKVGLLNKNLSAEFVSGVFMDRIFIQVVNSDDLKAQYGVSIEDPDYRKDWIKNNIELFLNGLITHNQPSSTP